MKKVNFQSIIKLILSASLDNSHELLAPLEVLEGKTALETCKNLWYFVKNNIKYHLDKAGTEQIRTPKRTWEDRRNGVDCEDYSIFIAAALLYWNIPCSFRIADYGNGYQHIYVFTQDCILDCCEVAFNQEQAFVRKLDIPVQPNAEYLAPSVELPLQVAALSGPGNYNEHMIVRKFLALRKHNAPSELCLNAYIQLQKKLDSGELSKANVQHPNLIMSIQGAYYNFLKGKHSSLTLSEEKLIKANNFVSIEKKY